MIRIPRRGDGLRRALTAGLAVGITLGAAASAHATFPGTNGKLVFADLSADSKGIYSINPDSTGRVLLAGGGEETTLDPEWSPDGTKIAFSSDRDGSTDIHVMNADGTGRVNILSNGATPAFSPDGTKIAFTRASQILVMNADGTGVTSLAIVNVSWQSLDWSPDGTTLVAAFSFVGGGGVLRLNIATGTVEALAQEVGVFFDDAEWNAAGTKIFFHRNDFDATNGVPGVNPSSDVWSMDPDGTGVTRLTTTDGFDGAPAPSPDGTRVAFRGSTSTVSLMNPDGSSRVDQGNGIGSPFSFDWQPTKGLKPLTVEKLAFPRITKGVEWEVLKSVSTKAGWDAKDGSLRVDYRVEVKKRPVITDVLVAGQITVTNPNTVNALINVGDTLPGATCTLTTFGQPLGTDLPLKAGASLMVNYVCRFAAVPAAPLVNTANVTWKVDGVAQTPVSGTATVDFATAIVDDHSLESVEVTDTMAGEATKVLAEELSESKVFRYRKYIEPGKKCETYMNTARLIGFSAPVPLNVPIGPLLPNQFVVDADSTSVRVCPPTKDDPSPKDPPVVVIDNGDGPKVVDPKPADNPKVDVITDPKGGGAKLRVTKSASVKRAAKGSIVTWSITVKNTGKSDLDDVVVRDLLPKGLVAVTDAKAPLQKAKRGKKAVTFSVGDLLRGQSVTVTLATRVGRLGRVCNVAQAEAGNARSHRAVACIRIAKPVNIG